MNILKYIDLFLIYIYIIFEINNIYNIWIHYGHKYICTEKVHEMYFIIDK